MSERQGLFCRYDCQINGRPWHVIPKSSSSLDDLKAAISTRDAHEVAEHGAIFVVFVPEKVDPFNHSFTRKTKK